MADTPNGHGEQPTKARRGFAAMADREKQRAIAKSGGIAAHRKGTAHEFTSAEAQSAGKSGGRRVLERYGQEYLRVLAARGGRSGKPPLTEAQRRVPRFPVEPVVDES